MEDLKNCQVSHEFNLFSEITVFDEIHLENLSQNSAQGTSICRAYTHKHISTKVLFISISCLFLFSIFPFHSLSLTLLKYFFMYACAAQTSPNILWKEEKVSVATRFCCSHFFNLKAHTKQQKSFYFLNRHNSERAKEKV